MTDPHLQGGGQVTYVNRLSRALTQLGHRVVVGCKTGSVLVRHAQGNACPVADQFTFKGGLRPCVWWRDIGHMQRYIRQERPDIIHVNGSQDHWISGLGNRLLGYPTCILRTRHNTYTVKNSFPNRVLNRSWTDYQIVVCDIVRRGLAQQPVFDAERMESIHNGVDPEAYAPDPQARERIRHDFGYDDTHVVCGIAARLVPAKGHEFFFRAAAQLTKQHPNMRVLVLGQGDLESALRQMVVELGIQDKVRFGGFRNDIAQCTQAFDIGVLPSVDCDTSSFSLKEEMAAEKPVVASDYGGLTEIVDNELEGLIVPAGTVEPLAQALHRLIEAPELRVRMGKAGRTRVLRDFSIDVFARRTEAAYYRALELHQMRRGAGV